MKYQYHMTVQSKKDDDSDPLVERTVSAEELLERFGFDGELLTFEYDTGIVSYQREEVHFTGAGTPAKGKGKSL